MKRISGLTIVALMFAMFVTVVAVLELTPLDIFYSGFFAGMADTIALLMLLDDVESDWDD